MKLPGRNIAPWAKEIIDECSISREERLSRYRRWTDIYYTGSDNETPSKRNRCFNHVDKLSSYLFSPSEVEFDIEFDDSDADAWRPRVERGQNYLNRMFARSSSDIIFGQANEWSLVKGCCLVKQTWGSSGFEPWVIQPEFFGVLREDIEDLDRQDAFCHTFFLTPTQFRRMLGDRRDRGELVARVEAGFAADYEGMADGSRHELSTGGGWPNAAIGVPGVTPSNNPASYGTVDWTTQQPGPNLAPEVRSRLIRMDDLWVWNDKLEDWTTIRMANTEIVIEGADVHRNLSDAGKGEHPFVKVCSNKVPGYFWGRSEIAGIWPIQKMLTARLNNIDSIFSQQARPARAALGTTGITDEKLRALTTPGGVLTDSGPTTKIETYKPEMPQGALEYLTYLDSSFDEMAGFTKMLQGEGEAGVRAGVHANTLLRTSSPRLRDRALIVEKQAAQWGDLCLKMLRMKDASVLIASDGSELIMSQLPDDASVVVDSHTSSPAFSGDNQQLMFALAKARAVGPRELVEGTHPARKGKILAALDRQEKSQEAMMQELKQVSPEAWAKAVSGTGRKR